MKNNGLKDMIDNGFDFYKVEEIKENTFIQIPKQFYTCPFYRKYLTSTTRELYGWLRDRMSLSEDTTQKGDYRFVDENGYIYFIFTRQEVGNVLGLSKQTVSNAFDTLNKLGLIFEKRLGQGKTNRIYIGKVKYMNEDDSNKMIELIESKGLFQKSKNSTSEKKSRSIENRLLKNRPQEVENLDATNTNPTETDLSSSSRMEETLIQHFKLNVCEFKPTTLSKFKKVAQTLDKDFIIALIDYCANANAKSYSYFEKVLKANLNNGINTVELLEKSITEYREIRDKANDNKNKQIKNRAKGTATKGQFNNYDQRSYDFEDVERKLLGWDGLSTEE